MQVRRTNSHRAVCATILVALVSLLTTPRDVVLCVRDGGHVEIEAALELVSCQFVGPDLQFEQFENKPTETCSDMPLTSEALREPSELGVMWDFVAISPPPAYLLRLREIETPSLPVPIRPSASSFWLRDLRTIVLVV